MKYAQQALRLGVFDFLLKQITPGDLDQMLRRYQENMQKKARALSCSFYFSFFDESNTVIRLHPVRKAISSSSSC